MQAAESTCAVDGECPSGAGCMLGKCAPLCSRSIDCPGSDGYCTDHNRCRSLPSPDAPAGFVFEPSNHTILFGQPTVALSAVQDVGQMPVLVMDLVSKRLVATNAAISFGDRLEITYGFKDSPECRTDPSIWGESLRDRTRGTKSRIPS